MVKREMEDGRREEGDGRKQGGRWEEAGREMGGSREGDGRKQGGRWKMEEGRREMGGGRERGGRCTLTTSCIKIEPLGVSPQCPMRVGLGHMLWRWWWGE